MKHIIMFKGGVETLEFFSVEIVFLCIFFKNV